VRIREVIRRGVEEMYKLMVSHDAGCSYNNYGESEKAEDFKVQCEKYDEEGLRWVIEDEAGNIVEASLIHKQIISFMQSVRQKEKEQRSP